MSFKDYVENSQIEKKLFAKTDSFKYKIRKSVAAFANGNGGKILIGAPDAKHETESPHAPVEGIPPDIEIGTWLDSVFSSSQLIVPAPSIEIEQIKHGGRIYALLSVKKASLPIGVRKEVDIPLEYNKRGNQSIVPFSFEDFVDGFNTQKEREARLAYAALWMVITCISALPTTVKNMRANQSSINLFLKAYEILFSNYGALLSFAKTQGDLNDINRLVSVTRAVEESLNLHNERVSRGATIGNLDQSLDQIEEMIKEVEALAIKVAKLVLRESKDTKKLFEDWIEESQDTSTKKDQPVADQ